MLNKSHKNMEIIQKQANGVDNKTIFQQANSKDNQINLNEFVLGKRLSISGQSGSASNNNAQS